jgi:hypothetical protein
MTTPDPIHGVADSSADGDDASTGLTWLRTWPGVYLFVMGSFVTWVALLLVFGWAFS